MRRRHPTGARPTQSWPHDVAAERPPAPTGGPGRAPTRTRAVQQSSRARETSILLALLLVIVVTTIKNPSFLFSADGFRDLLLDAVDPRAARRRSGDRDHHPQRRPLGRIGARPHRLPDRPLFIDVPDLPIVVVFARRRRCSARLLGLINGALVAFAKVPALVITLGTLYAYRGINVAWTGSDRINAVRHARAFLALGTELVPGHPVADDHRARRARGRRLVPAYTSRGGRELYAIGSDPDAADLYGLRVTRGCSSPSSSAGALAGLAGVLFAARYGTVNSQARAPAASCRPSAPPSSAASRSSAAAAPSGAPRSARSCCSPSTGRCPCSASRTSGSAPWSACSSSARSCSTACSPPPGRNVSPRARDHVMSADVPTRAAGAGDARTYRDYSRPLWQRIAAHPRDRRSSRCSSLVVVVVAVAVVPQLRSPITITYLLARRRAVLLIALPMTLIIITGEIDLSVASIVGPRSVLLGLLHQARAGRSRPPRSSRSWSARSAARSTASSHRRRPALARGHHRHARAVPRPRRRPPRHHGGHRVPASPGPTCAKSRIPGTPHPGRSSSCFVLLALVFARLAALHPVRPRHLRHRPQQARRPRSPASRRAHQVHPVRADRRCLGARRHLLHAALRQRPRRQRHRPRAPVVAAVLLGGVSIFGGRGAMHGVVAGVLLIGVLAARCAWRASPPTSSTSSRALLLVVSVVSTSFLAWVVGTRVRRRQATDRDVPAGTRQTARQQSTQTTRMMNS